MSNEQNNNTQPTQPSGSQATPDFKYIVSCLNIDGSRVCSHFNLHPHDRLFCKATFSDLLKDYLEVLYNSTEALKAMGLCKVADKQGEIIASYANEKLGWNGVENSKILSVFIRNYIEELEAELKSERERSAARADMRDRLLKKLSCIYDCGCPRDFSMYRSDGLIELINIAETQIANEKEQSLKKGEKLLEENGEMKND